MTVPTDRAPDEPRFAVRIGRGLVTHWLDGPLMTWEQANEARRAIIDYTGEQGEVERVVLHIGVARG